MDKLFRFKISDRIDMYWSDDSSGEWTHSLFDINNTSEYEERIGLVLIGPDPVIVFYSWIFI